MDGIKIRLKKFKSSTVRNINEIIFKFKGKTILRNWWWNHRSFILYLYSILLKYIKKCLFISPTSITNGASNIWVIKIHNKHFRIILYSNSYRNKFKNNIINTLSKQYKINQSVICLRKKNRFEIKN